MTWFDSLLRWAQRWGGLAMLAVAAFGLLWRLDGLTLRQWDEARLGVNALEMHRSGQWRVTTYGFRPDLWNVKPPLMIWLQAGLIKLLGTTEWAVRLPAALAALATIGLVYLFCARALRRPLAGVIAGSYLISSLGFLGEHYGHTGDYDALLGLWEVTLCLACWLWLETKQPRWWLVVAAGLALAVLTKGVAVVLCLPGIALYALWQRQLGRTLRAPGFWLAALVATATAAAWYTLREAVAPGYLAAVWENELGGRFGKTLEKNGGPFTFYVGWMMRAKMLPWVYVLPLVIPFALRHPEARTRRLAQFAACWAGGLLLFISLAKTKLVWYMVPAFPPLALLAGVGGPELVRWLTARVRAGAPAVNVLAVALVVVPPFITISHELRGIERDNFPNVRAGYALRTLAAEATPPAPLHLLTLPGYRADRPQTALAGDTGYNASERFYLLAYPAAARAVDSVELLALRAPGYLLTTSAADSTRARRCGFGPPLRQVGVALCWLWSLPARR